MMTGESTVRSGHDELMSCILLQLLIDGKFVDSISGKTFASVDPRYNQKSFGFQGVLMVDFSQTFCKA